MSQAYYSKFEGQGQPLFGSNGRVVAELRDDTVYKAIFASKHMLRQPPAICFDQIVIQQAKRSGALWLKVFDREEKQYYFASMATMDKFGFQFNRGAGPQMGLCLDHWTSKRNGNRSTRQLPLIRG